MFDWDLLRIYSLIEWSGQLNSATKIQMIWTRHLHNSRLIYCFIVTPPWALSNQWQNQSDVIADTIIDSIKVELEGVFVVELGNWLGSRLDDRLGGLIRAVEAN